MCACVCVYNSEWPAKRRRQNQSFILFRQTFCVGKTRRETAEARLDIHVTNNCDVFICWKTLLCINFCLIY